MGWRFRKSVKIASGVRVNFGKKSTSVSVGGKGYRKTFSSTGKTTTTVGIPGTGLSYSTTESNKKKQSANQNQYSANSHKTIKKPAAKSYRTCGIILQILSVVLFVLSLMVALVTPVGIVTALFACFLFVMGIKYKKQAAAGDQVLKTVGADEETNCLAAEEELS